MVLAGTDQNLYTGDLLGQAVVFFFFFFDYVACGILVPNQA